MDQLMENWKYSFYTEPALVLTATILFLFSIRFARKFEQLNHFQFYFAAFVLLYALDVVLQLFSINQSDRYTYCQLMNTANFSVLLLEFWTFTHYIEKTLRTEKFRAKVRPIYLATMIMFTIPFIEMIATSDQSIAFIAINQGYIIESLSVLILSTFYFVELFESFPVHKLTASPNFWVSTGLTFFFLGTLPVSLIFNYLAKHNMALYKNAFAIIYVFYILFFLMVLRGYTLKPEKNIQNAGQ